MSEKLFLTGPSGSGKTVTSIELEKLLRDYKTIILDGDQIRATINSDLGFSKEDIFENARRVGEISRLLEMQNFDYIIISAIYPYTECRKMMHEKYGFKEFFINRPACYTEDLKGLYASGKQTPYYTYLCQEQPKDFYDIDCSNISPLEAAAEILINL